MSGFTILTVRTPEGNGYTNPAVMKRVNDHLMEATASFFESNNDGPIKQQDGMWRVRAMTNVDARLAEHILVKHYGLEIIRRETVD